MFLVLTGIFTRIVSNSYLNVFQKILTSKGTKSSVINFSTYLGLTVLSFILLMFSKYDFSSVFTSSIMLNTVIIGILGALGNYFIIKALSIGELSTLAPINSYKPIVGILGAYLYLREIPSISAFIGIILIILGTYFILKTEEKPNLKALLFRFLALIFSGSEAVFIKKIILLTNVPVSFFLWAFSGLVFSFLFVVFSCHKIKIASYKYQLLLILSVGIMQFSTNFVFSKMNVGYALALFQLSTLLSVYLGTNIFKEKELKRKIIASLIMVCGAVVIILS